MKKPNEKEKFEQKIDDHDSFERLLDECVKGSIVRKVQEETTAEEKSELDLFVDLILDDGRTLDAHAIIDSGCTNSYIDVKYVAWNKIPMKRLPQSVEVLNADGTENEGGNITHYVELNLQIGDHIERIRMPVLTLKSTNIFLGYSWLNKHNPNID